MKIGRLLPGFIKDPLTRALSAVLNYVRCRLFEGLRPPPTGDRKRGNERNQR